MDETTKQLGIGRSAFARSAGRPFCCGGAQARAGCNRPRRAGRWLLAGTRTLLVGTRALLTIALTSPAMAAPAAAQTLAEVTRTPESTADAFLRSVRAIRWETTALLLSPATLDRFRQTVTMISDADESGEIRSSLVDADSLGLAGLAPGEVFARSIGTVIDGMPGLMHALYDRDDEVIGHVLEAEGVAHVVYRTTARLSGAVSEIKVLQMLQVDGGWRVAWGDELEVLDAALRGFAR